MDLPRKAAQPVGCRDPIEVLGQTASTLADVVPDIRKSCAGEQFKGNGLRTKSSAISPISNGFMDIASD